MTRKPFGGLFWLVVASATPVPVLMGLCDPVGPTPWNWRNGAFVGTSILATTILVLTWVWFTERSCRKRK